MAKNWQWLLGVVGVGVAVVAPLFLEYIRSQGLDEPVRMLFAAKENLSAYYARYAAWPGDLAQANVPLRGDIVEKVVGSGSGESYTVLLTLKQNGLNETIAGKSLAIHTEDGGKSWICGPPAKQGIPTRLLVAACRNEGL